MMWMIVLSTRENGEKPLGEVYISVILQRVGLDWSYVSVDPQASWELLGLLLCRVGDPLYFAGREQTVIEVAHQFVVFSTGRELTVI